MGPQAKDTWSRQKMAEPGKCPPREPLEGVSPAHTCILDFWSSDL